MAPCRILPRILLTVLAVPAGLLTLAAGEGPRPAVVTSGPADLAASVGSRLGGPFDGMEVKVQSASVGERRGAVSALLTEAFAPLRAPACGEVLEALGRPAAPDSSRWTALVEETAPVGSPRRDALLVPPRLPPQDAEALELLRASGVLPFEVTLTGEWARVVAAEHLGPPPKDPLLRLARVSRMEGAARLAGVALLFQGAGLDPRAMGLSLVETDRDRVGLPRERALALAANPVERAVLVTLLEDGLRWAAYHYLRGGYEELLAALERPFVTPAELLRPGVRLSWREEGGGVCHFGPRIAAALVTGDEDPSWIAGMAADRFEVTAEGDVEAVLTFIGEGEAAAAMPYLRGNASKATREGKLVRLRLTRPGRPAAAPVPPSE